MKEMEAFINGDIESVKNMIRNKINTRTNNIRECVECACENGHIDIVKLMIDNYEISIDYVVGFIKACSGGHINIVELMIYTGERKDRDVLSFLSFGLGHASEKGHIHIVEFILSKYNDVQLGYCMYYACEYNHINIIDLLISKNASVDDLNSGLQGACRGGNLDTVKYMISKGAGSTDYCIRKSIINACKGGHMHIINFLIKEKEAVICNRILEKGMREACHFRHIDVINFLIDNGATNFQYLMDIPDYKLYCLYCEHFNVDKKTDNHFQEVLSRYPVYVLLKNKKNSPVLKKMPIELIRLLHKL